MKYKINNLEHYEAQYQAALKRPGEFWNKIGQEFSWYKKWSEVCDFDMVNAEFSWFKNAKTNITENCIDRHLKEKGAKTALIFEPNDILFVFILLFGNLYILELKTFTLCVDFNNLGKFLFFI